MNMIAKAGAFANANEFATRDQSLGKTDFKGDDERRIHEAAVGVTETFMTQVAREMLENAEIDGEDLPEKQFTDEFLSQGLGKNLARSKAAGKIVGHIENKMRRLAGLNDLSMAAGATLIEQAPRHQVAAKLYAANATAAAA